MPSMRISTKKSGRPKGSKNINGHHKYSKEELEWLKENYPLKKRTDLQKEFNKIFNCNITVKALTSTCKRHEIYSGRTGHFKKGHVPMNKGKTWDEYMSKESQQGCMKTTFKPGNKPVQYLPVGSEVIDSYGYHKVKIGEPNQWKFKHTIIYEVTHGPLPEGHVVVFLDQNKNNLDLDNLREVSRAELLVLNQNKLLSDNQKLSESGVLVAKLITKANSKNKQMRRKQ